MLPVGAAGKRALYLLGLAAAVKAAGLVLLASAVASGVAGLAAGTFSWDGVLLPGVIGALLRAAAAWGQDVAAQRAAAGVKEDLRARLSARILDDGGATSDGANSTGDGALSVLATRGLDNLDDYYTKYLPALVTCAVVPLLVGLRILTADWVSALIVVLTLPLVPVFMILIGKHTEDRTEQAAAALDRLSDHLLELARGLPVLVGLGRAAAQTRALRDVASAYRERTMVTLRVAFLSSLALELIATISVAVVAVFVGIRLVYGGMELEAGLLALILAPDCFQPLRDLGSAHHASEDGLESLKRSKAVLDAPAGRPLVPAAGPVPAAGGGAPEVRVSGLSAGYPGRGQIVEGLDFTAPAGRITALSGPSGGGKSTVLEVLAGLRRDGAGIRLAGEVSGIHRGRIAWIPQHPVPSEATAAEEVALYAGLTGPAGRAAATEALSRVNAASLADADTGDLSPGELRRVAVARALARIEHVPGVDVLLADEPTAHVDEQSARAIEAALAGLRGRVTTVLVAHDPDTAALADHVVPVVPSRGEAAPAARPSGHVVAAAAEPDTDHTDPAAEAPGGRTDAPDEDVPAAGPGLWRQVALLRPWSPRFLAALCFGLGAALFAVSLAGLSGWLIVYASEQPPILHLMTSIVGVRFFGIGRSVLRYQERLKLHDAVFESTDRLRIRLWNGLLQRPAAWRRLARGGGALERLVGDVDELRDVAPRAVFAPLVGLLVAAASCVATALLMPAALGWQLLLSAVCVVLAPAVTRWVDRHAQAANVQLKGRSLNAVTRLLAAAPDLAANTAARPLLQRARRLDRQATAAVQRSAWAQGLGHGLTALACSLAAVVMIGAAGGTAPGVAAVVVLMQLALVEPFMAVNTAVQQWGAWRAAGVRVAPDLGSTAIPADVAAGHAVETLELRDASYRYPDAAQDAFAGVDLRVERGQWLAVTGPSGSGKSTLLGVLLGFLPLASGQYLVNGTAADAPRSAIAWMPQEAHLFNSTVRANLLLARRPEEAPSEEQMRSALTAVGLGGFLPELPEGLDTRIGPGGHFLSGGQRQRVAVARALLADSDVVLLDEPTAHLDREAADDLLLDLRRALAGKAVVMVTHDERQAQWCDHRLRMSTGRYAAALG
ncbi:thiol reductant ABC exporter subunit CydD [Arthrobacter sulfonylureivorans]|uniref:Thiol reductant ABC exporter subunit CydD n=1 Tax=Arthrobacter sulfonylureivorans TaxID=2486855 RepID=A0ABY3WGE9_9MICC|nr:thiol reductant ABC exporter subunit CydD [Arthrobacter sulfonylureivorans]UNK47633.1 thiol reductant ABC exporter subunit CydD [Arthrobacter sulfonylureivorans]